MELKPLLETSIRSLNNNSSIETIMLQAQTIAHILKDESFAKWVDCEQNGYTDDDILPQYRILGCEVRIDVGRSGGIVENYAFPPGMLGEYDDELFRMSFRDPITKIERFMESDGMLKAEVIAAMYSKMAEFIKGNILNVRQVISTANLTSITSTVKSKLLGFFLQLNDEFDMDIDLTQLQRQQTISNIMNQTISAGVVNTGPGSIDIKKSNVIGGGNNNQIVNDDLNETIKELLTKIKGVQLENNDEQQKINESVTIIQNEMESDRANLGVIRKALNFLKTIPSIMAVHGIEIGMDKALEMLQYVK